MSRRIVLESLRLRQSEYLWRIVDDDIDFEGYRLPRGATLRICVREAHRNPEFFDQPLRFDPDRFLKPDWPPRAFAPFGIGLHTCFGQELTLGATALLVERMAKFDWRTVADGPTEFPAPRGHWQPSHRFRVGVSSPAAAT